MHRIGHVQIPTTNVKKAKKFFGKVFGWTFTDHPEIGYTLFHTGSHPNGGLELVKKMPKRPQTIVYIEVEDVAAKLKEIKKAKGKIVEKKTEVPGMGWYGIFRTPDGCELALWQSLPKSSAPATPAEEHA
ncbi:MAG TPA: VOC family protein [Bacteroidota bacterium]|nr:VOC family protein [Bacteroidota bacterium]